MNNVRSTCTFALVTMLASTAASAQVPSAPSAAATAATSFEVASIKLSPPGDLSNPLSIIPMAAPQPGGRFTATNMPLWALIGTAWELPDFRIVGGNKELLNTKYHITAKASSGGTLGQKQLLPLLKNLIIERFQLKFHFEPREMSHYDLVLAHRDGSLGPELKPTKSDCSNVDELNAKRAEAVAKGDLAAILPKPGEFLACTIAPNLAGGPTNLSLHGDGQEIKVLVDLLSQFTGKYVRDKTGLTGRYDFDMKLDMQALMGLVQKMGINVPAAAVSNLPSDGSSVMTVLNEQLGLKLESTRGPVDVLVIDSVEAPTVD
ncbi:MAG TPA: TIGR03435 family protein [Vicinamibacterales bacterium]|nr:TIGR03435 family protein [Vicinamibacterales bacterium]